MLRQGLSKPISLFERFDPSLDKYKSPVYRVPEKKEEISLDQLWGQYTDFKMSHWLRKQHSRSVNPFSMAERDMIIHAFERLEAHQHYSSLVKFFFLTGCCTSEAVGLKWVHVSPDFTFITFQEVVIDGRRQLTTKTNKVRRFPINNSLKTLLLSIQPEDGCPDTPIFTDSQGNLFRPNNFLRRHWQPVVKNLPMIYRPQYNTRHTFITLCLQANIPVTQVAAWVGNSPRVIWDCYAGFIPSEVPEF